MRAVLQRVVRAAVRVEGRVVGEIGAGAVILLGVGRADTAETARAMAQKIANLRVFVGATDGGARGGAADKPTGAASDGEASVRTEKANRSLLETGGAALVVSQFTLYGDARNGRRPSYTEAAPAELARQLYEEFASALRELGVPVQTGVFQAHMEVELVGDGPVTLLLDSDKTF
ncbi:MAG: D-aminoacyl-tRNA deacylase [Candidatus Acidiferrales bacterium]